MTRHSYIQSIGTAVPQHRFPQQTIANFMSEMLGMDADSKRQLEILYRASKIAYRHSVLEDYGLPPKDFSFYKKMSNGKVENRTVAERMAAYKHAALPLSVKAAEEALAQKPEIAPEDVTHLITVSCTGMYAPGLDIEMQEAMGLRKSLNRTAINFMGCYGAFIGFKTADAISRADPKAKVLMVCTELCSLHFQLSTLPDHLLSGSLFADGVAAVLMDAHPQENSLKVLDFYSQTVPQGKQDMAWNIGDFGFEMQLSAYVPNILESGIASFAQHLLAKQQLSLADVDWLAVHPGGKGILEKVEAGLDISREKDRFAWEVLKNFGNMSSATVVFVLQRLKAHLDQLGGKQNIMGMAFGPGLTMESALFQYLGAD